jgi:REP element-mobilizing transposase RayT
MTSYTWKMARARKRHIQQNLAFPNAARNLRGVKREPGKRSRRTKRADGQARRPVGRPKKGVRASERHEVRPTLRRNEPVHVTLRVHEDVGRLRRREIYAAVREALITVLPHEDCRIVHLSIQGNHIHLLVEAENRMALARGMQAFQISAAKHINAAVAKAGSWWERRHGGGKRRKGTVFPDRYHAEIITSPRQARHALSYVLNNWRKHREDRAAFARGWRIDPFSTAWAFEGWKELEDSPTLWRLRETYQPMPAWRPRSWLLREGWRRHGLIRTTEVPGTRIELAG